MLNLAAPSPAALLRMSRTTRLALVIALGLALCGAAVVIRVGLHEVTLAVDVLSIGALVVVDGILLFYRPVVLPLAAYAAVVPFDNLLQTGGGTVTKYLGLIAASLILLVMVDRKRTVTPPVALAGWALLLSWSLASLMWAIDPAFDGDQEFIQMGELFALFAIFSMLRIRAAEVGWILFATLAGGVLCSLYGLFLYVTGHVAQTDALSTRLQIEFAPNSYINADHFSAALVFPVAIALVAFLRLDGWRRIAPALAFVILLAGILVSATRGSLIAVAVMCVYLAIVERRRMAIIAAGVLGLLASLFVPNIWARFVDPEQGNLGGRTGIWAIGMNAFKQHWLAGAGVGNFRLAYEDMYIRTPQHGEFFHPWMEYSHNLLINTGVEIGVIGIVIMLGAWFLQFRTVARIPRDTALGAGRSVIEAGTIGMFAVAMALDIMWYKYVWLLFTIGVLVRNAYIAERTQTAEG